MTAKTLARPSVARARTLRAVGQCPLPLALHPTAIVRPAQGVWPRIRAAFGRGDTGAVGPCAVARLPSGVLDLLRRNARFGGEAALLGPEGPLAAALRADTGAAVTALGLFDQGAGGARAAAERLCALYGLHGVDLVIGTRPPVELVAATRRVLLVDGAAGDIAYLRTFGVRARLVASGDLATLAAPAPVTRPETRRPTRDACDVAHSHMGKAARS